MLSDPLTLKARFLGYLHPVPLFNPPLFVNILKIQFSLLTSSKLHRLDCTNNNEFKSAELPAFEMFAHGLGVQRESTQAYASS